jgi:hypothetical protein
MKSRLRGAFTWYGDRTDRHRYADGTGWCRRPDLLGHLGPALAHLFAGEQPTVVIGPESRGCFLGPLVALCFDVGFVEVRKTAWPPATVTSGYSEPRHRTIKRVRGVIFFGLRRPARQYPRYRRRPHLELLTALREVGLVALADKGYHGYDPTGEHVRLRGPGERAHARP